VVQFEELAAAFGYSLGLGALPVKRLQTRGDRRDAQRTGRNAHTHEIPEDIAVTPRMYQKLAARIEGNRGAHPELLMLRSLKQARIRDQRGALCLAAPSYTHFTSPIRVTRPDCSSHRQGASERRRVRRGEIAQGYSSPWTHPNEAECRKKSRSLRQAQGRLSTPPRSAQDEKALIEPPSRKPSWPDCRRNQPDRASRRGSRARLVEWKKVRFMQDRVARSCRTGAEPAKYGLFVELTDLFVEGLVPIDSCAMTATPGARIPRVIGERNGRRFRPATASR